MIRIPIVHKERNMGAGPIEDQATQAVKNGGDAGPKSAVAMEGSPPPPQSGGEYFGTNEVGATAGTPETAKDVELYSPEEELIKSQHLFIESLTDYIHSPNVGMLAACQESYITAQTRYIARTLGKK
jgi:hypothetical protein